MALEAKEDLASHNLVYKDQVSLSQRGVRGSDVAQTSSRALSPDVRAPIIDPFCARATYLPRFNQ